MKKRTIFAVLAVTAVGVLIPLTMVAAGATGIKVAARKAGTISVQSWLYVTPSENVLAGTVEDCFKITGAISDEGGDPLWTNDDSFHTPNSLTTGGAVAASHECGHFTPAGGFIYVPAPEANQDQFASFTATKDPEGNATTSPGALTTVYAVHTIAAKKGDIFVQFAGSYNFSTSVVPVELPSGATVDVQPLTSGPECSWLITGGTGAYAGLQGRGTYCHGDAQNTWPYVNHSWSGQVWWAR